jgi:L-proline amide hydrolase
VTGTIIEFDVTDRLHEIEIPCLFLCGQFDEATANTTQYYASLVSGSFKVLEESSHMTYVEQPEAFKEAVREILNHHKRIMPVGVAF